MREFLRDLPVFAGVLSDFDTDDVPDVPQDLFAQWLRAAVEAGVREPHAMTLSTTGPDGPDARVLICKDVDARETCLRAVLDTAVALRADPGLVEPSWTVYVVRPDTVEFWQADKDRMHQRLRYEAAGDGWTRTLLWP